MLQKDAIVYRGFVALFVIITSLMLCRAFWGIEITDEAYYLAEGRTVYEGNIPVAFNNSNAVGMTILMTPFVALFSWLEPSYEGYFLYMRICFVIFKAGILLGCFVLLKSRIGFFYAACGILVMSAQHLYAVQNFSYNTISSLLIFSIGVLLFFLQRDDWGAKKENAWSCLGGGLSALAVFAHPAQSINILFFMVLLLCFRQWQNLVFYIAGGFSQLLLFGGWIMTNSSLHVFVQGLQEFLGSIGGVEKPIPHAVIDAISDSYQDLWETMLIVLVISIVVLLLEKRMKCGNGEERKQIVLRRAVVQGLYFALVGAICILWDTNLEKKMETLGAAVAFVVIILLIFFPKHKAVWFLGIPDLLFCLFEAFGTVTGYPPARFIHVVPALLTLFAISGSVFHDDFQLKIVANQYKRGNGFLWGESRRSVEKLLIPFAVASLCVVYELSALQFVYRDDSFSQLTYKVEQGIYKGLYTSERRAKDTVELENYIKGITTERDYIAFRDNVPVGYLMMKGHICDIRTWDCMQYSYRKNNPNPLYAYYDRVGRIPDKIIYVDFGRDKCLSIDDEAFLYNEFLNRNYEMKSDVKLNETYKRVVLYGRKEQ